MTNIIHYAAGAPGSGKTKNLIRMATQMASKGRNLLICSPTKKLCNETSSRFNKEKIKNHIITDETVKDTSVYRSLEKRLNSAKNEIFLSTHETLFNIDPISLTDTILIIDETPSIIDLNHITMAKEEWNEIFHFAKIENNTLTLKDDKKAEAIRRNNRYKSDKKKRKKREKTSISANEHHILESLINNRTTLIRNTKNGICASTIKINNIKEIISHTKETHLLAANIKNGLFEKLAVAMGVEFKKSELEVNGHTYNRKITIYPLFKNRISKYKLLLNHLGDVFDEHLGIKTYQNIDIALDRAITHAPLIYPYRLLVFANDWAEFDEAALPIRVLPVDMRGINSLSHHHTAICIFGGNASPLDIQCLKIISSKFGISLDALKSSWLVTKKLEQTLQCVTRTSIRNPECKEPLQFYVQDTETAEYLRESCMPNAVISNDLLLCSYEKKPEETKLKGKNEKFLEIIREFGTRPKKEIIDVLIDSGFSKTNAYARIKNYYQQITV